MFYWIHSWDEWFSGYCNALCLCSHLVYRKYKFFPQCETGLWHLLSCILLVNLAAHLLIHCCQYGENIFSSAKNTSSFVLEYLYVTSEVTVFLYIILTCATANGSSFKPSLKQLGELLQTISVAILHCSFHFEWSLPVHIIHLCIQIKLVSSKRKIKGVAKKYLRKYSYRGQLFSKCWHSDCMYQVPWLGLL